MKTIIKGKWRFFTAFILIAIALCLGSLSLSLAGAKQRSRPEKAPAAPAATRSGIYTAGSFAFSAPLQMTGHPPSNIFYAAAAEPEIKVDLFGNIYITAISGVPGGTDLWKSTDKGVTFSYLGQPDGAQDHCATLPECSALGGGDDSIAVSNGGFLYVSSLWLGSVTVSTSTDGGMGGVLPGQAWSVNPAAATIPGDDRQWLAAYGPETVYMSYTDILTGVINFQKSTDSGKTFSAPVQTYSPLSTVLSDVQGNIVVDQYNGNIYICFIPIGANNQVYINRSTDGGATWTLKQAYAGPAGTSNVHVFPTMAVDRGGNIHVAFSACGSGSANCQIQLVSSADQGNTWLGAVTVSNGPATATAVQPTIAAGSPGVVNITWLGSSAATPDVFPNAWHVFFAQTQNAMAASPTFAQNLAETPTMHDWDICMNGLGCAANPSAGGGNRDLLEYYSMDIDPDGNAHIAYTDSVNNCSPSDPVEPCISHTWYVKQTAGPSAKVLPAAPAPATFASPVAVGSPGAEPSVWVDSFNCIYVTAPGNPWVWKSVDNGSTFPTSLRTNPVATEPTLTGGDEDIITVPKQDGSATRPDQVYFTDLGLSTCHIRKSTDGAATWVKPGPGGAGGDVSVSSDRQWLAWDQKYPTAADQIIYHWEHELASEVMRFSSLFNDTTWVFTSGITDPELLDPLTNTLPNTNPGPVFANKTTHRVFGLFNASVTTTNAQNPPFGKLLNVWEADAAAPINAASPVTDVQNHHVFKGVYDSPNNPPPAQGPPTGPTYGTNNANIFPGGDIDAAGNVYVAWSMNNSRTNEFSIWFAASHDGGKTYYGPFPVSSGPMTADETAVFPWVAAGDDGRVNIIWYGTSAVGDPNTIPTATSNWYLHFAQSLNGSSREPVFTVVKPNPTNIIHTGRISTGGLLGSSDRSLLDFMEIAVGPDGKANIIYADNAGQATRAEFTRQSGGPLVKANPTFPTCLPGPPTPTAVVSRKVHSFAGTFDINLLPPAPGIECRTGGTNGDFQMVVTFPLPVTITGATVSSGTGSVASASASSNVVTVNLTGVTNAQRITVTLNGVTDANGSGAVPVNMAVLLGDTNEDAFVNSADIGQTKSRSGLSVNGTNFRSDVTIDGNLNSADIGLVKSKSGTALP